MPDPRVGIDLLPTARRLAQRLPWRPNAVHALSLAEKHATGGGTPSALTVVGGSRWSATSNQRAESLLAP